jgi:chemosensory pili system protein ChpE
MGAVGITDPTIKHYAIFFAGFMGSSILWSFLCAGLVDRVFGKAGVRWARLSYRACAVAFLLLALSSLQNLWNSDLVTQNPVQPPAVRSEP